MNDETLNNGAQANEIQALSQRFLKLWQEQLSLMATNDGSETSPNDWLMHWNGMLQSGMMQNASTDNLADVMQNMGQAMPQHFPTDIWKTMMAGYTPGDPQHEKEKAGGAHDRDGSKARANDTNRAASTGSASINTLDLLRQLTSFVERLDQRLTKLEQQAVSSQVKRTSRKPSKGSAKSTKAKPTNTK